MQIIRIKSLENDLEDFIVMDTLSSRSIDTQQNVIFLATRIKVSIVYCEVTE